MTKRSNARSRTRPRKSKPLPVKRPANGATKHGKSTQQANTPVRAGTKQARLVDMMQKPGGATVAQMGTKTGWQPHSVRAALTGLRKRGIAVTRAKDDTGTTIYRIGAA